MTAPQALTLDDYRYAIPDLYFNGADYLGTCPSCLAGRFELRIYRSDNGDPCCSKGCPREQIEGAVRQALASAPPVAVEEHPPHPAASVASSPAPKQRPRRKIEGFTAAQLAKMEIPDPKWAVPGVICEGLNILAGSQKLGKSWLAFSTAIAVATGGRALGKIEVEQGQVLYLALEDTKRRLKDRLLRLLSGEEAPEGLTIYPEWSKLDEHGLEWLRSWAKNKPTRLIIIDTFKKIRGARSKNGSVYDEDYDAISELKEIADEFGLAILLVHHTRKATAEDVFDQVNGSMGLTGAADATLVLTRSRGKKEALLHLTGRDVEEQADEDAMALEWSVETGGWTLVGRAAEVLRSDERKDIIRFLQSMGQPMAPKEIAAELDKNVSTLTVLLMKMVQSGEVEKVGYGKYSLPQYIPVKSVKSVKSSDDDEDAHTERWQ